MYHATTRLTEPEFAQAAAAAKAQEQRILVLFRKYGALSPSLVLRAWPSRWPPILLTSVRRSITDLCKSGALTKTEIQVRGQHGRPETVWTIAEPHPLAA